MLMELLKKVKLLVSKELLEMELFQLLQHIKREIVEKLNQLESGVQAFPQFKKDNTYGQKLFLLMMMELLMRHILFLIKELMEPHIILILDIVKMKMEVIWFPHQQKKLNTLEFIQEQVLQSLVILLLFGVNIWEKKELKENLERMEKLIIHG